MSKHVLERLAVVTVSKGTLTKGGTAESRGIQSVENAYRILVAIQAGPAPMSLTEISNRTSLTPGSCHNYLSSLVRTGMVQSSGRGQYSLGPSLAALGMTAVKGLDQYQVIQSAALDIQQRHGTGVAVAVWSESGPVIVFNKSGSPWGRFDLRNGPASAVGTAGGNVFLAYDDSNDARSLALEEFAGLGASEEESTRRLKEIVTSVHRNGYAYQDLLEMPGYSAISAPVWGQAREVVYALTLTGPKDMIDPAPTGEQVRDLLQTSRDLSRQMGAPAQFWA